MDENEWERAVGKNTLKVGETENANKEKDKLVRTLRTVVSSPAWETLARAVNGVAGAIVSAQADLSTGFPVFATGTHWRDKNRHNT